ncbi:MAG: hypothetical protein VSS75_005160 [Candidatus Parabeggiatoa sp.]|nr:hypothetical protein [Candidatus Parabeggiatoa sp.]
MQEVAKDTIKTLSDQDWERVLKRLFLYTRNEEVVEKAVRKFLDGEGDIWEPQNPVVDSLTKHIMGIIDNL